MTINFYLKPKYRDIGISNDTRKDCILTPEAIACFEYIIASKEDEVTSESQEKDPYKISVSTKFLIMI